MMFGRANPRRDSRDTKRAFWTVLLAILLLVATVAVGLPVLIDMAGGSSHVYTVKESIDPGDTPISVDFSPDESQLAIATGAPDVSIYDVETGSQVATFDDFPSSESDFFMSSIKYSNDGRWIAMGEREAGLDNPNRNIVIIDTSDYSFEAAIGIDAWPSRTFDWTSDDSHLIVGDESGIKKIEVGTWNIVDSQSTSNPVTGITIDASDGRVAATVEDSNEIQIRSVDDLSLIESLNGIDPYRNSDFSNLVGTDRLVFASSADYLEILNTNTWVQADQITGDFDGQPGRAKFSPDDRHIAVMGGGERFFVHDVETGDRIVTRTVGGSTLSLNDIAYSSSGQYFVAALGAGDVDIYNNTGVSLFDHDSLELTVDRSWQDYGSTHSYEVHLTRTSLETGETETIDVTDEATVTSADPTNLTVDQANATLTATSNEDFNERIEVTANHEGLEDSVNVTVAERCLENVDILPVEHRLVSIFGPDVADRSCSTEYWPGAVQLQYLFAITFIGALIANRTGGFAGLAVIEIGVLMGYPLDFVSLGTVIASIFFTVFLFTQLASVTEFSGR